MRHVHAKQFRVNVASKRMRTAGTGMCADVFVWFGVLSFVRSLCVDPCIMHVCVHMRVVYVFCVCQRVCEHVRAWYMHMWVMLRNIVRV